MMSTDRQNPGLDKVRAYLLGGDAKTLALAKACYPRFDWRVAVSAAPKSTRTAILKRVRPVKSWTEGEALTERDIVATWGELRMRPALPADMPARQFILEAAPFRGDDSELSLQAKVLRLRPLQGATAPELGTTGLAGLLLRPGETARSGVVVVGQPAMLERANALFPNVSPCVVLRPSPTADQLFAASESGALLAEASQIAVLLARCEWLVTDLLEVALAGRAAGARIVAPSEIEAQLAWFRETDADGCVDPESYYGFTDLEKLAPVAAEEVIQKWRLTVGGPRRAYLADSDISLQIASLCFPTMDWKELTESCTPTDLDWIVTQKGHDFIYDKGRHFVFDSLPFSVEPRLPVGIICMRLKPLDGELVPELEKQAGLPPLAFPSEARDGVFVYGDINIVRTARARFPEKVFRVALRKASFGEIIAPDQLHATFVPLAEALRHLPRAETVVSDSPAIILAALSVGVQAQGEGEAQEWSTRGVIGEEGHVDASAYYGFADANTLTPVPAERAIEAWREKLMSCAEILAPPPGFETIRHVMIGQPGRAIAPFAQHLGETAWQIPKEVKPYDLEAIRTQLDGHEFTIYARIAEIATWIRAAGRAHWVVDRTPIDYPLMLTTDSAFIPTFHRHRVRLEGDVIVYAPEAEIKEWTAKSRLEYQSFGRRIRPRLSRLQTARRLARYNKVEMGRRYGPIGAECVLILGAESENPACIQTNPEMTKDIDVIRLALAERPNARVLYLPQKKTLANAHEMKAVRALGDRVRVVDQPISMTEFAHVACEVRTVDSLTGLMALAVGLPVVVHGRPPYAGLGLTRDIDASGTPIAPRVDEPTDLDTYLGWQFRDSLLFADVLDGAPMDVESFIGIWTPFLGELCDEAANRIVALACNPAQTASDRRRFIRALAAHAKDEHVEMIVERVGGAEAVKGHLDLASEIALYIARRGNWKEAINRVRMTWKANEHLANKVFYDLLVSIRRTLGTTEETQSFSPYILTTFRYLPGAAIKSLGDSFAENFFYGTALTMYASCIDSSAVLEARARCYTAIGDIKTAEEIIERLHNTGFSTEELDINLENRRGNTKNAIMLLDSMAKRHPADTDLKMRLAVAHRDAGYSTNAYEILLRMLRSKHGVVSCRMLAQIDLARMNTSKALGFISAHLHANPTDASSLRILADAYSFQNDLNKAGNTLLSLLKLSPLNIGAHTELIDLETEMGLVEADGFGPWTRAFDAFLEEIDQHSAETLMAQGRSRLQQHDFTTLRNNCRTIMKYFPNDVSAYAWHAHALAWEPGIKSQEARNQIRAHYDRSISREREDNSWLLLDSIRTAAYFGDIETIQRMIRENYFSLYIGDPEKFVIPRYSAAAALGDFHGVFDAMRSLARTRVLRRNSHHFRLALKLDEIEQHPRKMLISEGGVGDELRYSLIYPELAEKLGDLTVTVDKRLHSLFERTYPMIKQFVPLPRYHGKRLNFSLIDEIGNLPDRELAPFFNNEAWRLACESDVVCPVPCLLADLRKTESDFGQAHQIRLKPDPALVTTWQQRLAPFRDRLLVGVTWTSMLRHYQRIGNYLSHEEMAPLFQTPGAVFINCQYEPMEQELRWAHETLGVEIVDFPDLDKRDDFEGLAGLIANLDLFIGTGTTTTEFAALLGCETIYASFSMMNSYRNPIGTEKDRFADKMRIVSSVTLGRDGVISRIGTLLEEAIVRKRSNAVEKGNLN